MIFKREYEKLSGKVEDATRDWDADDDFEAFSNTKPNDHSTIVKVFQQLYYKRVSYKNIIVTVTYIKSEGGMGEQRRCGR